MHGLLCLRQGVTVNGLVAGVGTIVSYHICVPKAMVGGGAEILALEYEIQRLVIVTLHTETNIIVTLNSFLDGEIS